MPHQANPTGQPGTSVQRLSEARGSNVVDHLTLALIVALCAAQSLLPLHGDEFFRGDAVYFELARSIVETSHYGLNFTDVLYPPGFPALLALLTQVVGVSHQALQRAMPVFLALALVVCYQLLKREQGRGVAAASCLLIASSPGVFALATQWVYSDLPYFFTSMAALWGASRLAQHDGRRSQVLIGVLCTTMIAASVLIRTAGLSLIAGLTAWLIVGAMRTDRAERQRRLKVFVPIVIVSTVLAAGWLAWASTQEITEWPMLEGHPRSYFSQLKVKSGVQPELGTASVGDLMARIPANLGSRAAGLAEIVSHRSWVDPAWFSPLAFGTMTLVALGLIVSLRGGGGPLEWACLAHEAMYLLWPWPFEMRFLLPMVPLGCLYLWRGGELVASGVVHAPRRAAWGLLSAGGVAASGAAYARWISRPPHSGTPFALWMVYLVLAALLTSALGPRLVAWVERQSTLPRTLWPRGLGRHGLLQVAAAVALVALMVVGLAEQLHIGRWNQQFDLRQHPAYVRLEAARWIAAHAPQGTVVMARQMDVIHHHSQRKVVWLAPISDPQVLMDGIHKLNVSYVIVARTWSYYRPSETECMDGLLQRYATAFRTAYEEPDFTIYEVVR
jgi:hypothetical protein